MKIKQAQTNKEIDEIQKLFRAYEAFLDVDLCFQSFEELFYGESILATNEFNRRQTSSDDSEIFGRGNEIWGIIIACGARYWSVTIRHVLPHLICEPPILHIVLALYQANLKIAGININMECKYSDDILAT